MTDPYLHQREFFGTVSGNYHVLAGDTGLIVLVPLIAAHTIFIQKIHVEVTTPSASELWSFQDGAGVPIVPSVSAAAVAHFDFDFGPQGVPCTEAMAFVLNVTGATGAIGWISWEAYKKLTLGTAASASGGAPPAGSLGTSPVIISQPALGTTSTDGVVLSNPTPATSAVPLQISPRIRLEGQGWDTDDLVSRTSTAIIEELPVSANTVSGILRFGFLDPLTHLATYTVAFGAGQAVFTQELQVAGGNRLAFTTGGYTSVIEPVAAGQTRWLNQTGSVGVGFDFNTDGTLKLRTRTQAADANLSAASVRGNAVTVANLPATPVEGMLCAVTDSTVNTWGTAIVGGGANHVLAYYNGTAWTVAGK